MGKFAEDTTVDVPRSQVELERTFQRYGARKFMRGWDGDKAFLLFELGNRRIQMVVPMPRRDDFELTRRGKQRNANSALNAYEQACRQRWRAVNLVVKAKLEAVDSGISTIEQEFLAHIVLPSGQTVGGWLQPQIEAAYKNGTMPPLLPGGEG